MNVEQLTPGLHMAGLLVHIEADRTTFDIPVVKRARRHCRNRELVSMDVTWRNGDHCRYRAGAEVQTLAEAEADTAAILRKMRGAS